MSSFTDYDMYDGLGLAKLVQEGDVTPGELIEACIKRIEALNPELNAVVHTMYDRARRQAKANLPEGAFAGVPFLLKDLYADDAGEPSTGSCRLRANWRATHDCKLVQRYKNTGAIVVGRTNTPEFGIYAVTEPEMRGPTRNPWNQDHTPGGSSGGSAAAVASRMVPFAHGGDGGGSIRIPSAHCGLFGLKPTRARNPCGPFVGESWGGFTCEHVLTRSVRDSAAMLDATRGPDLGAPYQVRPPQRPYLEELDRPPGKLRIAFSTQALFGDTTHDDCVAAVEDAAKLAESLGHSVEQVQPEFDKQELIRAYLITVGTGVSGAIESAGKLAGRKPRPSDVEQPTWLLKVIGDSISASEYIHYRNTIQLAGRKIAGFFNDWDIFLTPTAARPPVKIGEFAPKPSEKVLMRFLRSTLAAPLRSASARPVVLKILDELAKGPMSATPNTMLFNMTGQPAMSVPTYWNSAGLPIGTQWVAPFGDESTLFRLAAQLEKARPWIDRRP